MVVVDLTTENFVILRINAVFRATRWGTKVLFVVEKYMKSQISE